MLFLKQTRWVVVVIVVLAVMVIVITIIVVISLRISKFETLECNHCWNGMYHKVFLCLKVIKNQVLKKELNFNQKPYDIFQLEWVCMYIYVNRWMCVNIYVLGPFSKFILWFTCYFWGWYRCVVKRLRKREEMRSFGHHARDEDYGEVWREWFCPQSRPRPSSFPWWMTR